MDAHQLEALWRSRLLDAQLRLDFARHYFKEVQTDFPPGDTSSDGQYASQRALRAENAALAEYRRVLRIFTDLIVEGKIPDEGGWRKAVAGGE